MTHPPDAGPGPLPRREEPPPFWGDWWRLYAAVLVWLALLILLFAWFGRRVAP